MKKTLLAILMGLSGIALADGVLKPAHGGRMVEAAGFRLEMVAADQRLDLYVTDHGDQPVPVNQATGKITLLTDKGKLDIPLTPAGDNRLAGSGEVAAAAHGAAVITVEGLAKRITARLAAAH